MGQRNIPLNVEGRQQAEAGARLVAGLKIQRIISSPLSRACETAAIIAHHLERPVTILDDLRERDWGPLTDHTYEEMIRSREAPPQGIEPRNNFIQRTVARNIDYPARRIR